MTQAVPSCGRRRLDQAGRSPGRARRPGRRHRRDTLYNQYSYDAHRRSAEATRNSRYARGPTERKAHSAAASASDTSKALRYASTSFTSKSQASTRDT